MTDASTRRKGVLPAFIAFLEEHGMIWREALKDNDTDEGFSARLRLQKYAFLAKYFGLDMGYSFNLYIHGPYSPDLARDYYSLPESCGGELPDTFRREEFLALTLGKSEEWLEALATAVDLAEAWSIGGTEAEIRELADHIKRMKPHVADCAEGAARDAVKVTRRILSSSLN